MKQAFPFILTRRSHLGKNVNLLDAIEKRGEAADQLMEKLDRLMERRIPQQNQYEGPDRRHA